MFYQVNSTRLPLKTYFQSNSLLQFLFLLPFVLVRKLFRIEHLVPSAIPDRLEPFVVEPDQIPEEVLAKIGPLETQMQACGFIEPVYLWIVDPFSRIRTGVAIYRHASGTCLGQINICQMGTKRPSKELPSPCFFSVFRDGTYYSSTAKPDDLPLKIPGCRGQRLVGASVSELWKRHNEQVALESNGKTVLAVRSKKETLALQEEVETVIREYLIDQGILVPCTEEQQQKKEAIMAMPGNETDREFAAVYAEIEQLANRKANLTNTLLMLVVTVGAFVVLGRGGHAWKPLLLIIGILFIHETGHLLAMRWFHYRNLRMFFIPFLGAAVVGQNYNVPGWKKAIVSLMGPLPGIALGAALGVVAAIAQWPLLMEAAFLLLVINAFNLLPIMPLDGGQLMHAVLFSRHPMFDVAFRTVAGVVLVLGWLIGLKFLAILGVFMLIGLPTNYRIGKAVHQLRNSGLDANSPDAQTIPVETAKYIYNAIIAALPSRPTTRVSAQLTLQGFELLNARPPGVWASIGLISLQAMSFLGAVVMVFGLMLFQHIANEQQRNQAFDQPQKIEAKAINPTDNIPGSISRKG